MSRPTPEELARLHDSLGDGEYYHYAFDEILEAKLMALDPEWMAAMQELYKESGCARWYA